MKTALVAGAGGFIGSHMVKYLKSQGYWVKGVDLKYPEFEETVADEFRILDLSYEENCEMALRFNKINIDKFDEVYNFAALMGGAGFIFTGKHDADIMQNSASINLNMLKMKKFYDKIFFSSSACIYSEHNQKDPNNPLCSEESAYPAAPDSEYGWEKLFSERIYLSYNRNYNLPVRIARFHNIMGPCGTWRGGKEKAPAAMCRKVIEATDHIEIWGDGEQTRSFLYIDECIQGVIRLMNSEFTGPVNIGSEEMISINNLAKMAMSFENKNLEIVHIDGPLGVRGRNSDNKLIREKLGWEPSQKLEDGMRKTYFWIKEQIEKGIRND